ncbi:MAG TPA: alanine racemase, partial [Acidimicrobiales bacterium]|nr:alanine racemase [Acidimicrobiales bacterium]
WLAVAQVPEAAELRDAGIEAPILLLSEPRPDEVEVALAARARITVYTADMIERLARAVAQDGGPPLPLHLKVDTGMHRVGAAPSDILGLAKAIDGHPSLHLESVWTHCAVADEPENPFTARQLERYEAVLAEVEAAGIEVPLRHAANSAAAIAHPASRYDLVRCGIALYGIPPAPALDGAVPLVPAVRLATEVAFVKPVAAGEGVSYGLIDPLTRDSRIATLPIGYADGVHRALGALRQDVLIRGRRCPMVGVVTMDQVMVDVGPDGDAVQGDEAVLLGAQGDDRITPEDWAAALGTIGYEIVCAIGARVERRYTTAI